MKTTKVILFDLWRTLGYSLDREPIFAVQKIIGYKVAVVAGRKEVSEDPDFMRACLTTNISDPVEFLNHLASMADLERVLVSYAQGRGAAYEPGVMNGRRGALGGGHPTNLGS